MRLINSADARTLPVNPLFEEHLLVLSESELRSLVSDVAIPRHSRSHAENNKQVAELIAFRLRSLGYETHFQGHYANVVALNPNLDSSSLIVVGAHYDSVANCSGADDNASGIASLLACARIVAGAAPHLPVCFVAFNAEEDGLLGSRNFVYSFLAEAGLKIDQAHILEMIGYATDKPNSQAIPRGMPLEMPTIGDFLGVVGNQRSRTLVDNVLALGKTYLPEFPVYGLKLYLGAERFIPDLGRSDHLPFWEKDIPALMWTDTAEFRNPHYHEPSDTPETLDYSFLKKVTQLLVLQLLDYENEP